LSYHHGRDQTSAAELEFNSNKVVTRAKIRRKATKIEDDDDLHRKSDGV
jgi:hypothetical protein